MNAHPRAVAFRDLRCGLAMLELELELELCSSPQQTECEPGAYPEECP